LSLHHFVLGWPWDQDENKIQEETYNALVKNNSNAPVKMYLNLVDLGKPRIVMTWTDEEMNKLNAKGGVWSKDSVIKKWVSESTGGEVYQDADLIGPTNRGIDSLQGYRNVMKSFHIQFI